MLRSVCTCFCFPECNEAIQPYDEPFEKQQIVFHIGHTVTHSTHRSLGIRVFSSWIQFMFPDLLAWWPRRWKVASHCVLVFLTLLFVCSLKQFCWLSTENIFCMKTLVQTTMPSRKQFLRLKEKYISSYGFRKVAWESVCWTMLKIYHC